MELKRAVFKRDTMAECSRWTQGRKGIAFLDLFDIPADCLKVWVSLHDRPSANRTIVDICDFFDGYLFCHLLDGAGDTVSSIVFDAVLRRCLKAGKRIWLQVEYFG